MGRGRDFYDDFMTGAGIIDSFRREGISFYKAVILVNLYRGKHTRQEIKNLTGIENDGQLSLGLTALRKDKCISSRRYNGNKRSYHILKVGRTLVEKVRGKCGYSGHSD